MKRVDLLVIITSLYIIATCSAIAPGDEDQECLALPNRPSTYNREVLMDSFNYMNLLENDGGPWIVVDKNAGYSGSGNSDPQDNDTFYIPTWRQGGDHCERFAHVCGTASQDIYWLVTQFINSTSTVQSVRQQEVYIGMVYAFNSTISCTGECEVYVYVLETNEMNQSVAIRSGVFKYLTSFRDDIGRRTNTLRFTPNSSFYSGFYLVFINLGTCISMYEVVVFYPICDSIFLEFGLNFTNAQMPEGASYGSCLANMAMDLNNATNDHVQGVCILRLDRSYIPAWTIISENAIGCMCVPGYSFINRATIDQCKACPPFTFKNTLSNTDVCQPCPLFSNTTENDTGVTVCPCDPGYYRPRAGNEDDLPCTRPPSAPHNLSTSNITNTTVFLQWDNPLDDGNRSDVFYTISENISNSSNTTNTTSFVLENLIPFVYYEIRVTAENGISSQDPLVENRSFAISVKTLEGIPPPIEIKIINDIIQPREPIIYPHGNILRYEIVAIQNSSEPILLNVSTLDVPTSMLLTEPGTYSVKARAFTIIGGGPYGEPVPITYTKSTESDNSNNLGIIIGVPAGVVMLLTIVIFYLFYKIKKRRNKPNESMQRLLDLDIKWWSNLPAGVFDDFDDHIDLEPLDDNSKLLPTPTLSATEMKKQLMTFVIDYNSLNIQEKIAKGKFGVVYKGWYTNNKKTTTEVAIKTMKDLTSYTAKEFIAECNIANKFDHPNVLSLIGVSIVPEDDIPLMVMPYMLHGDVKSYLKSQRGDSVDADRLPNDLSYNALLRMCLDIGQGMEYLSSKRYVHRDLAARNCMLDESMTVKVADFGLSRDVYTFDYYVMQHSVPLPIKWLAPEALFDRTFTEKTDVWAFGVTCWEIFSLGLQPYPMISASEIGDYLKSGQVLDKPTLSSDKMYNVMKACWNFMPDERPDFGLLVTTIGQQLTRPVPPFEMKRSEIYLPMH